MTSSFLPLPISVSSSSSFRIPSSSSHCLRPSAVAFFPASQTAVFMGDTGKSGAFGRGRSGGCSTSRGCSGCGDAEIEDGIRILEQEGMLLGAAAAAPFFSADRLQATVNDSSKWIISILFCSIVLLKHDAEALWALLGSIFNAVLSVALKRVINQERPVANLRSDPGMPSSHAQSISFIVTFSIVTLIEWAGFSKASLTISGILLALGVYLSWLRVSHRLHTTDQVVVGGLVGTSSFLIWYILWRAVISRMLDSFLIIRVLIVLGAACSCTAFVVYVMRNWLSNER